MRQPTIYFTIPQHTSRTQEVAISKVFNSLYKKNYKVRILSNKSITQAVKENNVVLLVSDETQARIYTSSKLEYIHGSNIEAMVESICFVITKLNPVSVEDSERNSRTPQVVLLTKDVSRGAREQVRKLIPGYTHVLSLADVADAAPWKFTDGMFYLNIDNGDEPSFSLYYNGKLHYHREYTEEVDPKAMYFEATVSINNLISSKK